MNVIVDFNSTFQDFSDNVSQAILTSYHNVILAHKNFVTLEKCKDEVKGQKHCKQSTWIK